MPTPSTTPPPTDLDRIGIAWILFRVFVNGALPAARLRLLAARGRLPR